MFGMGTGVTPPVWPPTIPRAGLFPDRRGLVSNDDEVHLLSIPRIVIGRLLASLWSCRVVLVVAGCWLLVACEGKRESFSSSFTSNQQLATAFRRRPVKVAKLSTVSTGNLKCFRTVQLRPINRVVYPGSLGDESPRNPRLGIGFTLRCFQRLSIPDIATQPCR